MNLKSVQTTAKRAITRIEIFIGELVLRFGRWSHWSLAAAFVFVVIADYQGQISLNRVSGPILDTLIQARPDRPDSTRDVLILDIDEGSLATLSPHLGRWPWPNEAFGQLLVTLELVEPKAVVFDIIFSDKDSLRPASDLAFNRAIERSSTRYPIFFPMVRLAKENDSKSEIPTQALPGAREASNGSGFDSNASSTMAVLIPQIPAALDHGKLGFLNVHTDPDGVLRRYPTKLTHAGYEFDSYAVAVARHFGAPMPSQESFLINWRGPAFSLPYLSFSSVVDPTQPDLFSKERLESLRGKIIVIGSTAPALQDFKATPMGNPYPGLEALATAIDNLLEGETITPSPNGFPAVVASLFVLGMAWLFSRYIRPDNINLYFLTAQVGGLFVAWWVLSYSNVYLNFSAAVAYGTAFFAAGKLYNAQLLPTSRAALLDRISRSNEASITVVAVRTSALGGPELKSWYESVIARGQKRGIDLLPVAENADQSGGFADAFLGLHVFLSKAPFESSKEAVLEALRAACPQVIAEKFVGFQVDRNELGAGQKISELGPIALARAVNMINQAQGTRP